jgi:protein-L-isoaspartate(D-aspartate) O-methyltransferase
MILAASLMAGPIAANADDPQYKLDSVAPWVEVDAQIRLLAPELGFSTLSKPLAAALRAVPRAEFVPAEQRRFADQNRPLPIGYGQTISQPLIVAMMTALLDVEPGDRVLELGTGSGYQAAILDQIGVEVSSIEIIPELAERARATLDRLGHERVRTRIGDGYFGWPDADPFDAIIVTAAADHIPPPLIRQLKPGGRMVVPVGSRFATQKLVLVERDPGGVVRTREIIPVTFVPLTGTR